MNPLPLDYETNPLPPSSGPDYVVRSMLWSGFSLVHSLLLVTFVHLGCTGFCVGVPLNVLWATCGLIAAKRALRDRVTFAAIGVVAVAIIAAFGVMIAVVVQWRDFGLHLP